MNNTSETARPIQTGQACDTSIDLKSAITGTVMLLFKSALEGERLCSAEYDAPNHAVTVVEYGRDGGLAHETVSLSGDPHHVLMKLQRLRQWIDSRPSH